MQCAKCGYVLTDFDLDCARCKHFAAKGLPVPTKEPPPTVVEELPPVDVMPPLKVTMAYQEPPPAPLSVSPPPEPARYESLPPDALSCVVCGNNHVQKVSAVYGAGSYTEHTSGGGYTAGIGWDGGGFDAVTVTSHTTSGASGIARSLAPPRRPTYQKLSGCFLTFCLASGFFDFFVCTLVGFGGFWTGFMCLSFVAVIVQLAVFYNAKGAADAYYPFWQQKMANWDRLFYCPRCDHAFDPMTRKSARAGAMAALLD